MQQWAFLSAVILYSLIYTYLLDYPAEIAIQKRKKIL